MQYWGKGELSSNVSASLDSSGGRPGPAWLCSIPQSPAQSCWFKATHTMEFNSSEMPMRKGRGFACLAHCVSNTSCLRNVKWTARLKKNVPFLLGLLIWENISPELLVAILLPWRESLLENEAKPEVKRAKSKKIGPWGHFSTWIQQCLKKAYFCTF